MNIFRIINAIHIALEEITPENKYFTSSGKQVFFNKQGFEYREHQPYPALSFFITEESHLEHKGECYKQELNLDIEGYSGSIEVNDIYELACDVKMALLKEEFPFNVTYQGYEITLPNEGSCVFSVKLKFKVIYLEKIQ